MPEQANRDRHIVFTVVNDLSYDQRMNRICSSLAKAGYRVTLIGRELKHSKPLQEKAFAQKRFKLLFRRGKLFYLEYNLRLFLHFLFTSYDIFGGIDLDTLLAHFLAAKLKAKPHTYDAHEYFAELPEVVHRPFTRWAWKSVERLVVPRTKYAYTINQSYADLFEKEYGTRFDIMRNATVLQDIQWPEIEETYILYQGAVNVGRGVEEMIRAMPLIDAKLYVCGKGDKFQDCLDLVEELGLEEKVRFFGFVEPKDLVEITRRASLGFTFFLNDGLSYYLSLANRFFDYFHNGVPQLCNNYPEYARINNQYEIAYLLEDLRPETIAKAANKILNDPAEHQRLRSNCLKAREAINWQNEEKRLVELYDGID